MLRPAFVVSVLVSGAGLLPPSLAAAQAGRQTPSQAEAQSPTRPTPPLTPEISALTPPTASLPGIGAPVRGANGEVLGRIEAITRDGSGAPVQVVIRSRALTGGGAQSRAVPIASLRPDGAGWAIPLRRAEFRLLPAVRP